MSYQDVALLKVRLTELERLVRQLAQAQPASPPVAPVNSDPFAAKLRDLESRIDQFAKDFAQLDNDLAEKFGGIKQDFAQHFKFIEMFVESGAWVRKEIMHLTKMMLEHDKLLLPENYERPPH